MEQSGCASSRLRLLCLLLSPRRLTIDARYWHDVALGRGALLNVLTGGRALDLNLHHEFGGYGGGFFLAGKRVCWFNTPE